VAETDDLWGGLLSSVAFDPVTWTLRLGIEVVMSAGRHRYEMVLDDVSEWHSTREVPLPWNYAEVTEVHVSEAGGQVLVELVLWSEPTSLSVRCASVRVDRLS
jgi:hypothetical protein